MQSRQYVNLVRYSLIQLITLKTEWLIGSLALGWEIHWGFRGGAKEGQGLGEEGHRVDCLKQQFSRETDFCNMGINIIPGNIQVTFYIDYNCLD